MQKWGKHPGGNQRYRCSKCGTSGLLKRGDVPQKSHRELYQKWLLSKLTLSDFGAAYRVTRRTLDRWFAPFRDEEIVPSRHLTQSDVFIIDGYYVEYGATVLIAQNPLNQVVGWHFTYTENSSTWLTFLNSISSFPRAVVCDGQKGMLKAIKLRYPGVIIQRCQFHVIHQINLLLTKHPETEAARKLKYLVNQIILVKTKDGLRNWLISYKSWYKHYESFLKERTYQEKLTPTGRHKWHYTHGHLHASHSHLKNALPNLFQYLRFPQIPNTSNRIEGGINAQVQRLIDHHRGTKLLGRRQIIALLLKRKQEAKTN
ncbi:transposase [Candidatus Woesebacteria bacterium]|nr:transposase [Candidatus Woesebacteria bacterium]